MKNEKIWFIYVYLYVDQNLKKEMNSQYTQNLSSRSNN